MEQVELQATTREVLGKKVRFLRRQGVIPVHVFGHNMEPAALQCDVAEMRKVLLQTGKTGIISLKIDQATEPRNVVVREIQRDSVSGELLHVDFYHVSLTEKIKAAVPIILIGQTPALKVKENILVQELGNLTVACLPGQIPSSIELDVSSLTEAHQEIRVKNIRLDEKITIINDPEVMIVRIGVQRVEKEPELVAVPVAEAEVAAAEEKPEGEAAGEKGKEKKEE